jgi:hypothetical protein
MSHSRLKSLAKWLQPAEWLPWAFFDHLDDHHMEWSLTSFLSWLTITWPHVHQPTGTVFGGPLGVRVLAFAMSWILQDMSLAHSGQQVPTDIIGVIKGPWQNWSAEHAEHKVAQCIEVLSRDVQEQEPSCKLRSLPMHLRGSILCTWHYWIAREAQASLKVG